MKRIYDICFTKIVASGNDFVVIDNKNGELDSREFNYSLMAQDLCRRSLSIGADGLLVLEASSKANFRMRIFNPDGTEVDMCGNGARSSALYAQTVGWGEELLIETGAGIIGAWIYEDTVKLKMSNPKDIKLDINLGLGKSFITVHHINTGVPHAVHITEEIDTYDVVGVGRKIREHQVFAPSGTNADFVGKIKSDAEATLRTYERGVENETLACGTGTVASAIILGILGYVKSPVKMTTKSGEILTVYFRNVKGKIDEVFLEGKAKIVYEGKI